MVSLRALRPSAPIWFFEIAYRVGFAPWDGHELSPALTELVEGPTALPAGEALDIGCGTGDSAIYLAQHGWRTTGVDAAGIALDKARAKATVKHVEVNFVRTDATRLSSSCNGAAFTLILDSGCFHGMSDATRDRYVEELRAVAAPQARLLILAFTPGAQRGVRGVEQAEVERRFLPHWELLSAADDSIMTDDHERPARHYLLQRRDT